MTMTSLKFLVTLATIAIGLAVLEWWAVNELNGSEKFAGPIMGVAFVAALAVLTRLLNKFTGQWHSAVISALTALVELIFCVVVFGSLSAVAAMLLPFSITSRFMQGDSATDFIIFFMLTLGLVIAARGWAKYSKQALVASKAQLDVAERDRQLVRSELTILRAQIEPHFLWNTLAHVQYLTKKRPEDAERMTGLLIRFLRTAVPKNQGDMTTLGSELEAVDAYMEIMKIRMGARLTSTVEMEQSLAEVPFPPLLIQTLVENAIKHGLEPKVGPVTLSVTAKSNPEEGRISIEVIDNGVGLQNAPPSKGSGIGLKSVRERLQLLYGSKAELELSSTQDGGVSARIQLPLNHRD